MPDQSSAEFASPPESETRKHTGIRFEPGIHALRNQRIAEINNKFENGDLNAHDWNEAVKERMSSYQPKIVGLDGMSPLAGPGRDPKSVWQSLPGRPKDINKEGEVHVIAGDFVSYEQSLKYFSNVSGQNVEQIMEDLKNETADPDLKSYLEAGGEALGVLGLGFILSSALQAGARKVELEPSEHTTSEPKKPSGMTRRRFLNYASRATAVAAVTWIGGAAISRVGTTFTKSDKLKEFLLDVANFTRPRLLKDGATNARTALLISKTQDARLVLGLPANAPGSVVLGVGHTAEAEALLNNPNARKEVIGEFAGDLVDTLDNLIKSKHPHVDRVAARNTLLNYFTLADLLKVKDPGGPSHNPDLPNLVNDLVTYHGYTQSPQVKDAIQHLYLPTT